MKLVVASVRLSFNYCRLIFGIRRLRNNPNNEVPRGVSFDDSLYQIPDTHVTFHVVGATNRLRANRLSFRNFFFAFPL